MLFLLGRDKIYTNEFMKKGYFERYLNRMRKVYRDKHDKLLALLEPFEKKFMIDGEWSGLHLLLTAKENITEQELIKRAGEVGVTVFGMSDNLVEEKEQYEKRATILLGYAALLDQDMEKGIEQLKKAWL